MSARSKHFEMTTREQLCYTMGATRVAQWAVRSSNERLVSIALLGALLVLLVLWVTSRERSTSASHGVERSLEGTRVRHSSAAVGLPAIRPDAARPPLAWGHASPEHEPLLRESKAITPRTPDDARFIELGSLLLWAIPFGLPGEDGELAARCAHEYEPELAGACQWRTDYVIRRVRDSEVARLEYLRVTPTNDNDDPACVAFASCTAAIWSRQTKIPMPRELGDRLAFHEFGRGARWRPSKGDREQFYRRALDDALGQLDYFHSLSAEELEDDPMVRYGYEWTQRSVEEYRNALELLD